MQKRPIFYAVLLLGVVYCTASYSADQRKDLEHALQAKYEITKTGIDRVRITHSGTVLVIQKPGISADLSDDLTFLDNKIIDGKIAQAGGFGALMQDKKTSRVLKPGDKVFVFKIEVKDHLVRYFVLTCDTYDVNVKGSTKQTRYKALLSFDFPGDSLTTRDAGSIKKVVDTVVVPESEVQAASTKTVAIGQTPEEVEAILGRPQTIINLG